jgi:hypothetical protein
VNIDELLVRLDREKISKNWYLIGDIGYMDCKTCMRFSDGKWKVFFSERGGEFDLKTFDSESEACGDLLSRLKEEKALFRK